ncbi:MAG TPA: MFS transporter [Candidatus Sumerlaeota bacterium]|nr:MAG: Major Facilitator Superfamily protein [candidate division BRC1 bacterium ADurb.Bin183]HOE62592.1 MFS transporter [Candidatus Sumerlaeota bacterium]HON49352.1 MFS transporter [Candidatus Sumerlaeota bacterium]HPL73053.1 MFS transporter [Candidatus Sumerlaeota bacterium]
MKSFAKHFKIVFEKLFFGFSSLPPPSAPTSVKRRSGIMACLEEGIYAQIWLTLTCGKFLVDLALLFGASAIHFSLINGLPFMAATAQLAGAYLVSRTGSRKRVIIPTAFITRQLWWLILILIIVPIENSVKIWTLIALLSFGNVLGQISGNAWLAWIGDLIPDQLRGRVISARNGILILVALAADFIFSQMREYFGSEGRVNYLLICFGVAAFFGLKSIFAFKNQWEPRPHPAPAPQLSDLIRQSFRSRPIRKLLYALLLWNSAVGVATSFWTPHMIVNLKMSFTSIFTYTMIVTICTFLMSRFVWGAVIDRAGTLTVVLFCASIITTIPIFWLFISADDLSLLWCEAVVNGMMWSGFNVAIFNLPYFLLPKENRGYFLAVLAAGSGLALGIGAVAGGVVAQIFSSLKFELFGMTYINYHITFVLSAVLRGSCLFLLRKIPDTRSRGLIFMFQVIGDGMTRVLTNPRLILTSAAPRSKK